MGLEDTISEIDSVSTEDAGVILVVDVVLDALFCAKNDFHPS